MARMPTLTLSDGTNVELPEGEPVGAGLPKGTVAARVDGVLRDLSFVPARRLQGRAGHDRRPTTACTCSVTPRHTCSLRRCATLHPGAKYAIGPAIEDGFYYDFELSEPLHAKRSSPRSTGGCGRS